MENIASGLTVLNISTNASSVLTMLAPYLTLLLGILLALYVVSELINMLKTRNKKDLED